MKLTITLEENGKKVEFNIIDYYVEKDFLIFYITPNKKFYMKLQHLANFYIEGDEIKDEIEDKIDVLQNNSRD